MTRLARLGLVATLLVLASCGGGDVSPPPPPPPPLGGDLVISYVPGGPAVGAILFTISGGPVENVTVRNGAGLQVSFASPLAGTTKVLVSGALSAGDILTVRVPDISLAASYTVHIDQVADNVTFSLIDPTLNTLTIHP
ncbi:MAG TPA: hypothetical protein VGP87_06095 [Gemmatimonadales bacterium]|jgi:hypothetical protein|nr:hypothetical protein [Gemmatimonadales bacterium]